MVAQSVEAQPATAGNKGLKLPIHYQTTPKWSWPISWINYANELKSLALHSLLKSQPPKHSNANLTSSKATSWTKFIVILLFMVVSYLSNNTFYHNSFTSHTNNKQPHKKEKNQQIIYIGPTFGTAWSPQKEKTGRTWKKTWSPRQPGSKGVWMPFHHFNSSFAKF